jgi:hypothetical protein
MIPPHLHFALFITFLTLFLKLPDLEERVPKASMKTYFRVEVIIHIFSTLDKVAVTPF